jgi:hypothetical protein
MPSCTTRWLHPAWAAVSLAGGLVNNVHSYRWVTPATCNRFPTALDLRPR